MSEMDTNDQDGSKVAPPVVLVIGAPEAQKYLENNEVLQALYGDQAPVRVLATLRPEANDWMLFCPNIKRPDVRLALLDTFPEVPVSELPGFLASEEFYRAIFERIVSIAKSSYTGLISRWEDHSAKLPYVRVVICAEDIFNPGMPMRAVMERYFPEAVAFAVEYPGHGRPERIDLS